MSVIDKWHGFIPLGRRRSWSVGGVKKIASRLNCVIGFFLNTNEKCGNSDTASSLSYSSYLQVCCHTVWKLHVELSYLGLVDAESIITNFMLRHVLFCINCISEDWLKNSLQFFSSYNLMHYFCFHNMNLILLFFFPFFSEDVELPGSRRWRRLLPNAISIAVYFNAQLLGS